LRAETRGFRLSFFNRLTTPVFNRLYYTAMRFGARDKLLAPYDFLFPVHNKEVYFHLFGKRGFRESQTIVPKDRFLPFMDSIAKRLREHPVAITLASAKLFGGPRDLLRFSGDGICLALNLPGGASAEPFARFLDESMLHHGGWPNLIKDPRLSASLVAQAYPEYELFRERRRSFDPECVYRSELSERLGL
jgi:decaprenylphospho-beta-D-ribofuranose 2-oxidase